MTDKIWLNIVELASRNPGNYRILGMAVRVVLEDMSTWSKGMFIQNCGSLGIDTVDRGSFIYVTIKDTK